MNAKLKAQENLHDNTHKQQENCSEYFDGNTYLEDDTTRTHF